MRFFTLMVRAELAGEKSQNPPETTSQLHMARRGSDWKKPPPTREGGRDRQGRSAGYVQGAYTDSVRLLS